MSLINKVSLCLTPNAVKEGKLYSIIPSNGNGDMTVVRATTATRTNELGLIELTPYNLLVRSEEFENASWAKQGVSVIANSTISPDGTIDADTVTSTTTGQARVEQALAVPAVNTTYTFSIYAKAASSPFVALTRFSGNSFATFNLSSGTIINQTPGVNATIISVGNGWYRISIIVNALTTDTGSVWKIHPCTSTDAFSSVVGNSIFLWGAQLVQGSVPKDYFYTTDRLNVPRLNYDVAGGCPSILVEPQRTNLLLNSVWAGGGSLPTSWTFATNTGTSTPVTSIKNPNVTAYRFVTSNTRQEINQTFSLILNQVVAFSCYVESVVIPIPFSFMLRLAGNAGATGTAVYLKNNIPVLSNSIIEAGNTYSVVLTCTVAGSFASRIGVGGDGNITGDITLSMPQLEVSSYSTSFIPTTIQTITRNADGISKTGIADLIGQTEGTFFIDFQNKVNEITTGLVVRMLYSITDGTNNNRFSHSIIRTPTRNYTDITIRSNNVNVSNINVDTPTGRFKIAVSYKIGATKMFINGVLVGNVGLSEIPIINRLFLGCSSTTGGENGNVSISNFLTVKTALTDAECIALTTL